MRTEELTVERYTRLPLPTLRDLAAVLFRQWRPMLIVFVTVVTIVLVSGMWVPQYSAEMKILLRRQRSDAIVTSSADAPTQFAGDQVSEEDLNSEVELLDSQDILRKVVLTTGLRPRNAADTPEGSKQIELAVRGLGNALKIEPIRKTNIISVRYQARDPRMAAEVLNALAAAYKEKHLDVHRSSGEFAFFDQQMDKYKQGLETAQAKLTDFTKDTGVVSADLERDEALRQAEQFDSIANQAQSGLLETEQRVQALRSQMQSMQPRITTVVRTSDNPQLFEQLKSTLLTFQLKRTDLLTRYQPSYSLVKEVEQQIEETNSSIKTEESRPIQDKSSDINPNFQWITGELTKAQTDLTGLKARAASAQSIAKNYRQKSETIDKNRLIQQDLIRAAKTQEQNYLLYDHKREEARISDALDQRGILNVAMAEQPIIPALPTKSLMSVALFTLLSAGVFGLSAAFVIDFLDPSFRTPDEVFKYLEMPVLAALPKGETQAIFPTYFEV